MKTFLKFTVVFIITVLSGNMYAQSEAAIQMLYFNPSPKLNGLGMAGTSSPNEDPAGFYYNPAQLGYISQTNNISFQEYPAGVSWLNNYLGDYKYRNTSFNIGYNFNKLLNGLNLSAGFGYIHSKFDYGNYLVYPNGDRMTYNTVDNYDQYNAYGFGVGLDYFVQFNIGITYKKISSQIGAYLESDIPTALQANVSAFDYGLLLIVPVSKLVIPNFQFFLLGDIPSSPYLNFSFGCSKLNVGDEIYYVDPKQSEPLPRVARLGYTISTGLNVKLNNSILRALGYDFTVDADDYLVETDTVIYAHSYHNFLGDIKIGRNLLGLKSDDNVVIHIGHNISLFETVSFQIGRFDGRSYYDKQTSGLGIQSKGIFTLLKNYTKDKNFNFIADHLDIQYYTTKLFLNERQETKFEGINIIWYGMNL